MTQRRFRPLALALGLMAGTGLFALSAQLSAQAQEVDPNLVVAKLNGENITRQDVIDSAQNLPPEIQANFNQLFPHLLDRLVFLKLVANQGRADGLAEDPAVKELMRQYEDNAIREIFFERAIVAKVNDAAIRARYDEEVKDFPEAREVRASHILVKTEEEAKAIIEQLKAGGDFAAIAKEKSTDTASGKNGGDLNWFTKEIMVPEFADAAFAMKKGDISQSPVKSQFGFHIIRLDDERMKAPPSFEQRRDDIRVQLTEELRQQVAKELKDKAQLEIIDPSGGVKSAQ